MDGPRSDAPIDEFRPVRGPSRPGLIDRLRERFLQRVLRSLGPLQVERVPLPGTDITLEVVRPSLAGDQLPCELPYWAEIWPSGVVLAGMIAREPDRLQGRRVLELGPGVGVTAAAALTAGAELVVADSAPAALLLCARNARHQAGTAPRTLLVNWRHPSQELLGAASTGFAIVLAADILYEQVDVKPLVRLVERVVAPGGEVWLAEPGRDPAGQFVAVLERRGWSSGHESCACAWPDPQEGEPGEVTVHRLRRPLSTPARTRRSTAPVGAAVG